MARQASNLCVKEEGKYVGNTCSARPATDRERRRRDSRRSGSTQAVQTRYAQLSRLHFLDRRQEPVTGRPQYSGAVLLYLTGPLCACTVLCRILPLAFVMDSQCMVFLAYFSTQKRRSNCQVHSAVSGGLCACKSGLPSMALHILNRRSKGRGTELL